MSSLQTLVGSLTLLLCWPRLWWVTLSFSFTLRVWRGSVSWWLWSLWSWPSILSLLIRHLFWNSSESQPMCFLSLSVFNPWLEECLPLREELLFFLESSNKNVSELILIAKGSPFLFDDHLSLAVLHFRILSFEFRCSLLLENSISRDFLSLGMHIDVASLFDLMYLGPNSLDIFIDLLGLSHVSVEKFLSQNFKLSSQFLRLFIPLLLSQVVDVLTSILVIVLCRYSSNLGMLEV